VILKIVIVYNKRCILAVRFGIIYYKHLKSRILTKLEKIYYIDTLFVGKTFALIDEKNWDFEN
jgi:hypothetical protein